VPDIPGLDQVDYLANMVRKRKDDGDIDRGLRAIDPERHSQSAPDRTDAQYEGIRGPRSGA
jgi:hypothetical protein